MQFLAKEEFYVSHYVFPDHLSRCVASNALWRYLLSIVLPIVKIIKPDIVQRTKAQLVIAYYSGYYLTAILAPTKEGIRPTYHKVYLKEQETEDSYFFYPISVAANTHEGLKFLPIGDFEQSFFGLSFMLGSKRNGRNIGTSVNITKDLHHLLLQQSLQPHILRSIFPGYKKHQLT